MTRLWFVWLWSRLTRQHKMSWWEVKREVGGAAERDRLMAAIQREIDRHGSASRKGASLVARITSLLPPREP